MNLCYTNWESSKKYIRRPFLVTKWRIISLFARKYLKIRLRYFKNNLIIINLFNIKKIRKNI